MQVIKFTSCLPMVGGSLRVLRLLPPLKLVAMILLKVALKPQNSNSVYKYKTWVLVITVINLCNQCLSPLTWVRTPLMVRYTQYNIMWSSLWLATGQWFSLGTPVSSTNKTDLHDITKIFLKVVLNTITLTQ